MRKIRKPIPSEPGAVIDRHGNVTALSFPVSAGDGDGPASKGTTTFHARSPQEEDAASG